MAGNNRRQMLNEALIAIAKSGEDRVVDILIPALKLKDQAIVSWLVNGVGRDAGKGCFPLLLAKALQSESKAAALAALAWTTGRSDAARKDEIKRLVAKHFAGNDEDLKLAAAITLNVDYDSREARAHIIAQVGGKDQKRIMAALRYLTRQAGGDRKTPPELVKALIRAGASRNYRIRNLAAKLLAKHKSEAVARGFISLMARGYRFAGIEERYLVEYPDKELAIRLLKKEKSKHRKNHHLRRRYARILKTLEAKE